MIDMVKVIVCKGIPASGKSTWAKDEVFRGRGAWKRVNRDDIRTMIDGGVYSPENEKLVLKVRDLVIQNSVKNGINVIVDDTNIRDKGKNFKDICSIVEVLEINVQVIEKIFYISLDEALERDSKRPSSVGEKIVKMFWTESGGKQFIHSKPKVETFLAAQDSSNKIEHNPKLQNAIICDLDGTLALLNGRNPYDASRCDETDTLNSPVGETVMAYYKMGYKILFCSGREDKYHDQTVRFIKNNLPEVEYSLFMRRSGDKRKDSIIKDQIYKENIEGKYNVFFVLDDRDSVCEYWRSRALTCFQVAPGNF